MKKKRNKNLLVLQAELLMVLAQDLKSGIISKIE